MTGWEDYLDTISKRLEAEYEASDNINHAQTMGVEREIFLTNVLSELYPEKYVFTSGEIIDSDGNNSKQCDIIVYDERYPQIKHGRTAQLLAEGVLAHIEVKSELTKGGDLIKAYETCDSILGVNQYSPTIPGESPIQTKSNMDLVDRISTSIFSYTGYNQSPFENTIKYCLKDGFQLSDDEIRNPGGARMEIPEEAVRYNLPDYICVLDEYFIDISYGGGGHSEYTIDFRTDAPLVGYINSIVNSLSDHRFDEVVINHYSDSR